MRVSQYNHFQPWDEGHYLAYNSRTGGVALMTAENFSLYQNLAKKIINGDVAGFTPEETELLRQLEIGAFVYQGDYDELEDIRLRHNMARYEKTVLGLSFAPTMACNMACSYCYEDNKKGRMSPEVIQKIVKLVESQAVSLARLEIGWFGGEPLLAMDIIEDLTKSFFKIQSEHKFEYVSMVITNGYLLNRENVDRLAKMGVGTAQVTLDGPARHHNRTRPLKNGRGSFDTIIENLKYATEKMLISIRVNVDKNTTDEIIEELLQELDRAGLRERLAINFGHIVATTPACSNIAESCLNIAEFSKAEVGYYNLLLKNGFMIGKLPMPTNITCIAQQINSFLIDPEGRVFKCLDNIGNPAKAIGFVDNEFDFGHRNFTDLFRFDPFNNETCRACHLLPVCLGGCPAKRINDVFTDEECCASWKHNLQPMLELIAHSKQQQALLPQRS
ncbi:putative Radical SAM/SPASM domain Clo7bot peptide maturase [Candidatus Zixiibacteriota bacterium]|nr:putative Radical SAM/SPASM domain Clo7bot peptide maturase [candidate division Zixibacteria bacterium]